jgi:5-methylcytosine-specific restriction protein B
LSIQEALLKILNEWQTAIQTNIKSNELANFILKDFNDIINKILLQNGYKFKIKSSAGKGNWAKVPWLAVLSSKITETTQEGVYPVFLFRSDSTGVYLSLNQGTTYPKDKYGKKATQYTSKVAEVIRQKFLLKHWDKNKLDLRATTKLGQSYEEPNIYSKLYSFDKIPNENELIGDLIEICSLYDQIEKSWDTIKELIENELSLNQMNVGQNAAQEIQPRFPFEFNNSDFLEILSVSQLHFKSMFINRFVASLLSKPFVLLTGLTGSGKTKLALAFARWICQDESQYRIIPVGADWTNREPLLGYPNALNKEEYVKPDNGVLDLIIQANQQPEFPHFLILDEMNLSHVERYFADFLSVMESKEIIPLHAEGTVNNGVPSQLKVPSNLFIIGTVNIDETTNMFSPKVLDRANTIEFRVTQDEMKYFLGNIRDINMDALAGKGAGMAKSFLEMASNKSFATEDIDDINEALIRFFGELKKTGAEFGYRSATEILRLIHQLSVLDNSLTTHQKVDIAIMQKLLPKLHGSRRKLCPVLETLGSFCLTSNVKIVKDVFEKPDFDFNGVTVLYPLSLEKITRMYRGAIDNGFASFAEA